ncbi:UNVERIFIED_ORG: hypothetical protein E4P37_01415 [Bacillus sp. AZ43]
MTEPDKATAEQPVVEAPRVTTAPAHGGPLSRIPSHLGRARTSTVVLGILFVAIFALYVNIRPETSPPPAETGTEQPAPAPAPTSTPAPETTAEPQETTAPPATSAPTTPPRTTERTEPGDTTVPPEETSEPSPPSPETSAPSLPTGTSPTG